MNAINSLLIFRGWITLGASFISSVLFATGADCHYPTCFVGEKPVESRVFLAPHLELQIHRVGRLGAADLVLLRYIRAKGGASEFVKGYLITDKIVGEGASVFVRFPEPGPPKLHLDGPLAKAKTATLTWAGETESETLSHSRMATRQINKATIATLYRDQLTEVQIEKSLGATTVQLQETMTRINSACHSNLSVRQNMEAVNRGKTAQVDWNDFPYRCAELLEPLAVVCEEKQVRSVPFDRMIECRYTLEPKNSISVGADGTLNIHTSLTSPREGKHSFDGITWFRNRLIH